MYVRVLRDGRFGVELALATRHSNGFIILEVGGEIDVYTAPALRDKLTALLDEGENHIVVDLNSVEFLDSTGLGVLVGAMKRAKERSGSLRLACSHERILKIFRITGLEDFFGIVPSVAEATSSPFSDSE